MRGVVEADPCGDRFDLLARLEQRGDGKNKGLREIEQRLKDSGEDVVGFYNGG